MARFGVNCNSRSFLKSTEKIASLTADALPRHLQLMENSGALDLLKRGGWLRLYRSAQSFAAAKKLTPDLDHYGVRYQILDKTQIKQLEPDLGLEYAGALWMTETHSLHDPGLLCEKYFALCLKEGVRFIQQDVKALVKNSDGWELIVDQQNLQAPQVVITLGAWTNTLLAPLNAKLPFAMERGYHMMFAYPSDKKLGRSIVDVDMGYVLTPMRHGIRATTASNLVPQESPPDPRQFDRLLPQIKRTFSVGKALLDSPWMGRRATTTDSLPLIGPIDQHRGLFVATGHCHLGLTLGPITGELIADEISGTPNPVCKPFYPSRF
jgi:D-amino-acid dehydrogenase